MTVQTALKSVDSFRSGEGLKNVKCSSLRVQQ